MHSARRTSGLSGARRKPNVSEQFVPAPPIGPGEVLRKRVLAGSGLTQEQLAEAMQVSRLSINQIINGRRAVTAEMALRLARVTSTTPDFWLNLQRDVDVYVARMKLAAGLEDLPVLRPPKNAKQLFVDVKE
jgi:addiction module HigA family antidote